MFKAEEEKLALPTPALRRAEGADETTARLIASALLRPLFLRVFGGANANAVEQR
jgi:hypothetical protein